MTNENEDKKPQEDLITVGQGSLFGMAGGQLEFVSMEFKVKPLPNCRWQHFVVMKFTDHDLDACDDEALKDMGRNRHYTLEFPIA